MSMLNINVNDHAEKKNGLTYLSWAWAWAEVLKVDPQATWEAVEFNGLPCAFLPDSSALVKTIVTINGHAKSCWLPVMDHKNKAIKGPDAFAVNTAIVRCLTKCISMHGLGLYIYAGEDLPEPPPEDAAAQRRQQELEALALDLIEMHHAGRDMDAIKVWNNPATFNEDSFGTNQDERLYVWGLLKTESKLRSAIKANKPEPVAA